MEARRQAQRFQVDLELTLQSESTIWMGHAENVSDGGVFIVSRELKPIGTEVEMTIKLPGVNMPVWALGTVVWIRETSGKAGVPLGMGIQFRLIADDALRKIRDFIRDKQSANTAAALREARLNPSGTKKS